MRSNIPLCLQEFPWALPSGTPIGEGLYLTVYPTSRPNTDTNYLVEILNEGLNNLASVLVNPIEMKGGGKENIRRGDEGPEK